MMRTMVLGVAFVGAGLLLACSDMGTSTPDTAETFARAAVEVGRIDMAQMPEFEASVERMDLGQRTELWSTLEALHDQLHPSEAAADDGVVSISGLSVAEGGGCSPSRCSHSTECSAQWCCAFGEDAVYYGAGGCPVE